MPFWTCHEKLELAKTKSALSLVRCGLALSSKLARPESLGRMLSTRTARCSARTTNSVASRNSLYVSIQQDSLSEKHPHFPCLFEWDGFQRPTHAKNLSNEVIQHVRLLLAVPTNELAVCPSAIPCKVTCEHVRQQNRTVSPPTGGQFPITVRSRANSVPSFRTVLGFFRNSYVSPGLQHMCTVGSLVRSEGCASQCKTKPDIL